MDNSKFLIYDGSFNGFLTAIFIAFEDNCDVLGFKQDTAIQKGLFADTEIIPTQKSKAKLVWESIEKKSNNAIRNIYFAFLSETNGIEYLLYQYIKKLYGLLNSTELEQVHIIENKISKMATSVSREKSQIENLVDFQSTDDDVYITEIEPGYNILPLISRHFRYRYPKHQWIIFDRKRNYGMYYNGNSIEIISNETKNMYLNVTLGYNPYANNTLRLAI